uniref:NADH dehydrogenase subunit 6 n=1 Tax=Lamprotula gottschei TaxID=1470580 RepID=A0A1W2JPI2_9BIVA|nr:NADH dehydrogenase subunit 6 [Lamprotula gottschei]
MVTLMLFMSMMIFYLLSSTISFHPMILSIKVLLLALNLCLSISLLTTWYAYMIFMVTLGGVLVMFTYISSLAPNSIFKMKMNMLFILTQTVITLFFTYNLLNFFPKVSSTQKPCSLPDNFITFFLSTSNSSLLLTLASTLLLTMFVVMNLLSNSESAMRLTKFTFVKSSKTKNKINLMFV